VIPRALSRRALQAVRTGLLRRLATWSVPAATWS
jgi:hypothetical protein